MKTIIEAIKAGTFTPNMVGSWDKGGRFYKKISKTIAGHVAIG